MSSDNQFTALGPATIGFQTNGANIDVGAQIAGNQVGVKGTCQGAVGDGVQGFGTGSYSGVAGWGDPHSTGTGVIGFGGGVNTTTPTGPGVRGIGGGGPNSNPNNPVGVYGQAGHGNANGVEGHGGGTYSGVAGFGDPNSTSAIGVYGQAGGGNVDGDADGVQGHGAGAYSGVAGYGGARAGTGVWGLGGSLGATVENAALFGPGVRGIGGGGSNSLPLQSNGLVSPVGVYGQGGNGADGVQGIAGNGPGGPDQWAGVHGITRSANGIGVLGEAPNDPAALAGLFKGTVHISGALNVSGAKAAVVPFPDGSHRRLYCLESPESWFEDFGVSQLVNGRAEVRLDPTFASVVHGDSYHVFLTEYEDNNALYVTKRTCMSFEVHAKGSMTANSTFSYRVVAKRRDIAGCRLESVTLPIERAQATPTEPAVLALS